jgi:plasmid stability protein
MTALTIRQLPPPVERAIRERSARQRVSLNKAVVGMLEDSVIGKQKAPARRYHDLDWMCGAWSRKQAGVFQKYLDDARAVEPELWK